MIIGSMVPMELGRQVLQQRFTLFDEHGHQLPNDQPFVVLRLATKEEWYADLLAGGHAPTSQSLASANDPGTTFYEISVD